MPFRFLPIRAVFALSIASWGAIAGAAEPTPLGLWTTIDDHSHQPRSQVEITEHDGSLSGKVVRIYPQPGEPADPRCEDCKGERHNQPILGMTILWNLHRDGESWDGGEILDPDGGDTYRVTLHPSADGTKLEVRGYIGISLLGRTQVWERADSR